MTERTRWSDLREALLVRPGVRAEYERLRRAFALGEQVRALREAAGLSQQQLGQRIGTSQSAIARLETAVVEPKLDTLRRIGEALDAELVVELKPRPPGRTAAVG
jgi:ribosome-binding protein aMBF1 (putative translation factor)